MLDAWRAWRIDGQVGGCSLWSSRRSVHVTDSFLRERAPPALCNWLMGLLCWGTCEFAQNANSRPPPDKVVKFRRLFRRVPIPPLPDLQKMHTATPPPPCYPAGCYCCVAGVVVLRLRSSYLHPLRGCHVSCDSGRPGEQERGASALRRLQGYLSLAHAAQQQQSDANDKAAHVAFMASGCSRGAPAYSWKHSLRAGSRYSIALPSFREVGP